MKLRYDLALWADGFGNIIGFPLGVHDQERAAPLPQLSLQSWTHVGVVRSWRAMLALLGAASC